MPKRRRPIASPVAKDEGKMGFSRLSVGGIYITITSEKFRSVVVHDS